MSAPVRFTKMIAYRDRPGVVAIVKQASREAGIKPSQFIRSAVALSLTMAGYDVAKIR